MSEKTAKNPGNDDATNDVIHAQIVLDRSGSMTPIAYATIDALNGFLAKQRVLPGVLRVTLADFDSQEPFRIVADAIPVAEMLDLTPTDYEPRGATPLFDAIGRAIERCDARAQADAEEDQVLVIITDGLENASTDFDGPKIAALLEARQEAGWAVLFLGANQDSFATGSQLGMHGGNVRNFAATSSGIRDAVDLAADTVAHHRARPSETRRSAKDDLFDQTERQRRG